MVKKIKREQPQAQNEEENIALEEDAAKEEIALLEQEGDYAEETSVESINLEEELNEKADALKAEEEWYSDKFEKIRNSYEKIAEEESLIVND